jgi:hypothetical protein
VRVSKAKHAVSSRARFPEAPPPSVEDAIDLRPVHTLAATMRNHKRNRGGSTHRRKCDRHAVQRGGQDTRAPPLDAADAPPARGGSAALGASLDRVSAWVSSLPSLRTLRLRVIDGEEYPETKRLVALQTAVARSLCELLAGKLLAGEYLPPVLEELDLTCIRLDSLGLSAVIGACGCSTALRTLRLDHLLDISEAASALGACLAVSASLMRLEVSDLDLMRDGGLALAEGVRRSSSLEELHLTSVYFYENTFDALVVGAVASRTLRTLSLTLARFQSDDTTPQTCARLLESRTLTDIDLSDCGLNDACGLAIAAALDARIASHSSCTATVSSRIARVRRYCTAWCAARR